MSFGNKDLRGLERRLRDERPVPSASLMRSLSPRRGTGRRQFALAGALTAALLIALAAVGGVSYASNALTHAVRAATRAVAPAHHQQAIIVNGLNAGGDQYRPGYGWGDKNHTHTGPPGLNKGGAKSPPPTIKSVGGGKAVLVTTSITVDEQAALYFSVIGPNGQQLLLTQNGSTIGEGVHGVQAKTIHYVMLIPRTIPLSLRIPANLLQHGKTYRIRVIAVSPSGEKAVTYITFTAP